MLPEPMIELITGKRIGVLSILDEELIIPGGSDAGFLGKLGEEQVGKKKRFPKRYNVLLRFVFCVHVDEKYLAILV